MRKRHITILITSLLLATAAIAQSPCGFDPLYASLQENDSNLWLSHLTRIEKAVQNNSATFRDEEIFEIPVVVHIVWKEEEENLSEEIILNQMAILNEDFRGLNEDLVQVRPFFKNRVGDARIEFKLEKIIRVKTDSTFSLTNDFQTRKVIYPDGIKDPTKGGSKAWDPQYYLNIWVAAITDDLVFGYAYPPPGITPWEEGSEAPQVIFDGVVINYKAFGASPPPFINQAGQTIPLKGRTLVHELGHYFGLLHPWGNFELDQNSCGIDDGIMDTPTASISSFFDCNFAQNSCTEVPNDLPDMVENFMDFSSDDCRVCFTNQQIMVMRDVLKNQRKNLRLLDQEERFEEEIIIYPNPSPGKVRVYLRKEIKTDYQFRLRSIDRKILPITYDQTEAFPGISFSFDIGHLPNGVYFLELETAQWRFVKQVVLIK